MWLTFAFTIVAVAVMTLPSTHAMLGSMTMPCRPLLSPTGSTLASQSQPINPWGIGGVGRGMTGGGNLGMPGGGGRGMTGPGMSGMGRRKGMSMAMAYLYGDMLENAGVADQVQDAARFGQSCTCLPGQDYFDTCIGSLVKCHRRSTCPAMFICACL